MPISSVQAAISAAVTEIVGLLVAFAVINNTTAGILVASGTSLVTSAFVIANAIIHHGLSTAPRK